MADITKARGYNNGKGYTAAYVREVLIGSRTNSDISAIHAEVVALRTPSKQSRRKA